MVTLMIKTHNITGLKYFCKTTKTGEAFLKYNGSGKYWKDHLRIHGTDISTEVYGTYDISEVEEIALKFSEDNNIVKALNENGKKVWANEKPENGLDGAPKGNIHSLETIKKISSSSKGRIPITKGKSMEEYYGIVKKTEIINKMLNSKYHKANNYSDRFGKEKAKLIKEKISTQAKGSKNANASKWKLISPNNEIFKSNGNINMLIVEQGLSISIMKNKLNLGKIKMKSKTNKHNGWTLIKVEE